MSETPDVSGINLESGEVSTIDPEQIDELQPRLTTEEFTNWMEWLSENYYFTAEEFARITDTTNKIHNTAWQAEFWALWLWWLSIDQTKANSEQAYWHDGLARAMQRMTTWAARKKKITEMGTWDVES